MKKANKKEQSKKKYPYVMFYKVVGGQPIRFDGTGDAFSEAQARFIFRERYPRIRDIEAVAETWFEIDNKELQRRIDAQQIAKEREENAIKNAWWNRD